MTDKMLFPIADVRVTKDRLRDINEKHAEEVANSFLRLGQLQPIIIERSGELAIGAHRLRAAQLNGQTHIWAAYTDQIEEWMLREIELEENIRRLDMSAADKVMAIAEIDRIRSRKDPNWTQTATAAVAGVGQDQVSKAIKLSKMMELFPELKDAKSIRQMESWADAKAANATRVHEVKNNQIDYANIESKIVLGDSVDVIRTIPSESFHAIITDPPFGIDYDERKAGTEGSLTDYKDSSEAYERLLSMAPDLYRVLRPNGFLVWFFGMSWYERCKEVFRASGFIVDELPIVWNRSEGRCHTNRPDRYFSRGYDVALHCIKGDAQIIQRGKPNVITERPVETSDREALVERPLGLYGELIKRLTVPNEVVADFFVGSGSCPAAAASLGRDYFGVEQSVERRAIAIKKIKLNTPEPK